MSRTNEQPTISPAAVHQYRGQAIERDDTVPVGRRGRYTWGGRPFAQLRLAKQAIDDHINGRTPCSR